MSFDRQQLRNILRQISMLSQLGISLVVPILICVLFCSWLTTSRGVGGWVFIPGMIFGLGASFMTGYKFYLSEINRQKKDKTKHPVSFNRHD